jgi:uncharacterized protein YkwD
MRRPAILTTLSLLVGLLAFLAPSGSAESYTPSSYTSRLLTLLNQARADHGLHTLTLASGTTTVATNWSAYLAQQNALQHNPDLRHQLETHGSPDWTSYGENVGQGLTNDPDGLWRAYMESPEHRANILLPEFRYVGLATVFDGGNAWNTFDFVDSYGTRTAARTATKSSPKPEPKPAPKPSPTHTATAAPAPAPAPVATHEPARVKHERHVAKHPKPAANAHRVSVAGLREPPSTMPAAPVALAAVPLAADDFLATPVGGPRRAVVVALAVLALVTAARRWLLVGSGLA